MFSVSYGGPCRQVANDAIWVWGRFYNSRCRPNLRKCGKKSGNALILYPAWPVGGRIGAERATTLKKSRLTTRGLIPSATCDQYTVSETMSEQKDMQTEEKAADVTPERSAKKPEGAATTPHSAQFWDESSPEAQSKKVVAAAETVREYAVPRDDGKGLPAERLVPSTEDVRLQAMGGKDLLRIMPKVLRSGSSGVDVLCTVTDLMALGGAYEHELGDRVRRLAGNCEVRLQVATRALDGGSRLLGAQLAAEGEASREAFLEFA